MPFAEGTPTVEVRLDGESYTLGWTWAAKRRVRDHLKALGQESVHGEEHLSTVVWASMDKESRESLTVEDIEEKINPRNEAEIAEKIRQLIMVSEPEEPKPKTEPGAVTQPTPGSRSNSAGQLASTT